MALSGGQYAVTATAATLSSALGITDVGKKHARQLDVKNAAGNTGKIFLGGSNVTAVPANAWVELTENQGYEAGPFDGNYINLDNIYIIGSVATERVHIAVVY